MLLAITIKAMVRKHVKPVWREQRQDKLSKKRKKRKLKILFNQTGLSIRLEALTKI